MFKGGYRGDVGGAIRGLVSFFTEGVGSGFLGVLRHPDVSGRGSRGILTEFEEKINADNF